VTNTFTQLLDKRAESAARRDGLKAEIAKIDGDVDALDRVLALFDPSYQPANTPKPRRRARSLGFSRGDPSLEAEARSALPQRRWEDGAVGDRLVTHEALRTACA
jgi:hypothetical protein